MSLTRHFRPGMWLIVMLGCAADGVRPVTMRQVQPVEKAPSSHGSGWALDSRIKADCLASELEPYLDGIGNGWPAANRLTGVVLIAASDRTLFFKALGAADHQRHVPATADTSFRIGSISKLFTVIALLRLAEGGDLSLDGTVGQYLPEYPSVGAGITIEQLRDHRSGIPDYTEDQAFLSRRTQPMTTSQLLEMFATKPLEFDTGTRVKYSNSNFALLGAIIERVSGRPYAEHLHEAVFSRAGLTHTTVGDAQGMPDRAIGYKGDEEGNLVPAVAVDMSTAFGAGDVRSSANDLVRMNRALLGEQLLGTASKAIFKPSERHGLRVFRYFGGMDGFLSAYIRVPELDLVVVALMNTETLKSELIVMTDGILRCVLGDRPEPLLARPPLGIDAVQRASAVGEYVLTAHSTDALRKDGWSNERIASEVPVRVFERGDGLVIERSGAPVQPLLAVSRSEFRVPSINGTDLRAIFKLEFHLGEAGSTVKKLDIHHETALLTYDRKTEPEPSQRRELSTRKRSN